MWVEHMMAIQMLNLSVTTMILSVTMMVGEVMLHEGAGIYSIFSHHRRVWPRRSLQIQLEVMGLDDGPGMMYHQHDHELCYCECGFGFVVVLLLGLEWVGMMSSSPVWSPQSYLMQIQRGVMMFP